MLFGVFFNLRNILKFWILSSIQVLNYRSVHFGSTWK
ncbi:hypothetical protein V6Z11_D03G154700 [Gossypium hirsutum]